MSTTGKTRAILSRLPHFFDPEGAGDLLMRTVDLFGYRLERAEMDLYSILRAHHVETADNEGFRGFTAPVAKRGDLDKIFALYLEVLGGTSLLVKVNPRFTVRSLNARRLSKILIEEDTPLIAYFKKVFAPETWGLLKRYHVQNAHFHPEEIQPGFALALLLGQTGTARHVSAQLSPETRALLFAYGGGGPLDPRLPPALAHDLNTRILRDPALARENQAELSALPLGEEVWELAKSMYRGYFQTLYGQVADVQQRARLLESLETIEPAPVPAGDDQLRLNRMLLEAAFAVDMQRPWGLHPRGIPSVKQMRAALLDEFNRLLDKNDLFREDRFPDLAEDYPLLQKRHQDNPLWLNRLLLESAFPYELEKSYAPYRERLRGLIAVLRKGASTRQGIVDIVAANLGIVDETPAARAAKALIEIEEYLPRQTRFFEGRVGFYEIFPVNNTNPAEESPEIWVTMPVRQDAIQSLVNVRFVDTRTGQAIRYAGQINPGDRLVLAGTTATLNGITPPAGVVGEVPALRRGISRWRFEADIVAEGAVHPGGRFDQPSGVFDGADWLSDDPVVDVQIVSYLYTPGVFTVVIPWHIPGFTDKFAETEDHPRHQILSLANRVKAAGVRALIAYKQVFAEEQEHTARLQATIEGPLLAQTHDTTDNFELDSRQYGRETHEIGDALVLTGRLDATYFDSLNTFG